MMAYDNWRKRLEIANGYPTVALRRHALIAAGLTNMEPTTADEGFYRKPIGTRLPNGKMHTTDYLPVALFIEQGELVGVIGKGGEQHDATPNEIVDLWTWISNYPIPEAMYRAVAEDGEVWPDLPPQDTGSLYAAASGYPQPTVILQPPGPDWGKNTELVNTPVIPLDPLERIVGRDHNEPPEVLPEHHAEAIDNAISAAITNVTNETEAAQALGSKNRIAELRLKADKAGKALYDPPFREYKRLYAIWSPIVARAEAAEKKLDFAYKIWRQNELRRIANEQAEAKRKQQEIDDANERAAQRAIAQGEPERAPEPLPQEAPPAKVAPQPVEPTYGKRKPKDVESWHLDAVNDYDAVYAFFKDVPAVKALLNTLATAATKAGREVPGTTKHFGVI